MSDDLSLGHQITLQLMPVLMIIGAIMSLGANFWLPPLLLIAMSFAFVLYWCYTLKERRFEWKDMRFLILPTLIFGTGYLTYYHLVPAFYDQAYHLQISNRILDRWTWEPTLQGMNYSFRPEIISGIAAVELWVTGETSTVFVVPSLLLISAAWAIQHLGERFSDWRFGFIAGAVFCTFPVVLMFGRTMLLDVALAGMIVSVLHHVEMTNESEHKKLVLMGSLLGIIGQTKYAYFYMGAWIIVIYLLRKNYNQSKFILIGYSLMCGLFMLKNQIHTGSVFGPFKSQVAGTVMSIESISSDAVVYTPHRFLSEYVEQWQIILLCIALYGTALLIKKERDFMFNYWILILPAIFLHGYLLNFGWIRYSTPWLAMLSVGLPAAIWHSRSEFGKFPRHFKAPAILISILLLTSISPVFHSIADLEKDSKDLYEERDAWSNIYEDTNSEFDKNSIVVTGRDITMGLYSQTPCFRYEDPEYPLLQAINKFEATNVFTQDLQYRYDIDINSTFLFGSPIEPVKEYTSNNRTGRLWQVDAVRMNHSDWWRNNTIEVNGNGAHFGDFVWLENGSNFELLEDTAIHRIYQVNTEMVLQEVFDVLAHNRQNLLCDTIEGCSHYNRTEYLEQNWAVWMIKTDSE